MHGSFSFVKARFTRDGKNGHFNVSVNATVVNDDFVFKNSLLKRKYSLFFKY